MMNVRPFVGCIVAVAIGSVALEAQDLSGYRSFTLGSSVADVSTRAEIAPSTTRTLHTRPAVLQDLEWRPSRWVRDSSERSTDPVEQVVFSFYNDQLHRIVIDYAHDRTEGMTVADMVSALSGTYGTPAARVAAQPGRAIARVETESGRPVARWTDEAHAVVLYQTSAFRPTFRLIVTDARLQQLAQKAEAQSVRLNEQEAPSREIARQKKEREDAREAAEKARNSNKDQFRP